MADTLAAGRSEAAGLTEFLLLARPLPVLVLVSVAGAVVFCLSVFDIGFLLGTSRYWQSPRGLVGNSWADLSTALSGYRYFVRDVWTFPLFQTTKLGLPHAVNVVSTSIPLVCLFGRLLYQATGLTVNPYGAWAALCFVGSAVSMTALVAQLGGRGLAAALAATVFGLCMPALLARWGHLSLMAQWEPILALLAYARAGTGPWRMCGIGLSLLLTAVVLCTDAYLFAMVMGILSATLVRGLAERRLSLRRAGMVVVLFAGVVGFVLWIGGFLATGGALQDSGFGILSANLLSPLLPASSAIFPGLNPDVFNPTGGQYEGFGYLGLGGVLLLVAGFPWVCAAVYRKCNRLAPLLAVLTVFALFAFSNQIYAGPWHVVHVPLPAPLLTLASIFRSSGRFIWPCLYALTAALIVGVVARWGRIGVWLLVAAALLQIMDTASLRSALSVRTAEGAILPLHQADWTTAIGQHGFLRVIPAYGCARENGVRQQMAVELELLGSRSGIATNNVYAARHHYACGGPPVTALAGDELLVFLLPTSQAKVSAALAAHCAASTRVMVCSRKLDHAQLAALTRVRPVGCSSILSYEDMGFRLYDKCVDAPERAKN
ncbi:MAG TPA: DUF6311 domain-containing protein [Acetobacteraceae bacterium]|nr:DUF6311 domain-containing protein [Acetobacteraceae bacterium]